MLCSADRPDVACVERYEAIRRGAFWWSMALEGWLWSGSAFVLAKWHRCPWCDGDLPNLSRPYFIQGDGAE